MLLKNISIFIFYPKPILVYLTFLWTVNIYQYLMITIIVITITKKKIVPGLYFSKGTIKLTNKLTIKYWYEEDHFIFMLF